MGSCGSTDSNYLKVESSSNAVTVTWRIKHILCRCTEKDFLWFSPEFEFSKVKWGLQVHPFLKYGSKRFVNISLRKASESDRVLDVFIKIGLKDSEGCLKYAFESKKQFKEFGQQHGPDDGIIRREELEAKRKDLMPDDTLTVVCELRTDDSASQEREKNDCGNSTSSTYIDILAADMGVLLKERKDCDLTFDLGEEKFQAHKIILKARSPVFASMFQHDFEESSTNVVSIQDIRPPDFGVVLEYIYTGKVRKLSLEEALRVYATADKYDLKHLKSHCGDILLNGLSTKWFFEIAVLASAHNDGKLVDGVKRFARSNTPPILSSDKCPDFFRCHPNIALEILRNSTSTFPTTT